MEWSEFKAILRRTILFDENETGYKWRDENLFDGFRFAQRELCAHTALPAAYSIADGSVKNPSNPDVLWDMSTALDFPLPQNIYETVDQTGIVYTADASGANPQYFDPLFYSRNLSPYAQHDLGYWTDLTTLHLNKAPGTGKTLWIRYFAYWPEPASYDDDDFEITVPTWAIGPLAYLAGAHILVGRSSASAMIRQWNEKQDSGTPVQNVLLEQLRALTAQYDLMISRHTRQDRANFFRVTE